MVKSILTLKIRADTEDRWNTGVVLPMCKRKIDEE